MKRLWWLFVRRLKHRIRQPLPELRIVDKLLKQLGVVCHKARNRPFQGGIMLPHPRRLFVVVLHGVLIPLSAATLAGISSVITFPILSLSFQGMLPN